MVSGDKFLNCMWTYFLSEKSEAASALEKFLSGTRTDVSVQILLTDGRTEFKGPFPGTCVWLHMKHEPISAEFPQFDGCVERGNRHVGIGVACGPLSGEESVFGAPMSFSS